jgi:hypothetical protein
MVRVVSSLSTNCHPQIAAGLSRIFSRAGDVCQCRFRSINNQFKASVTLVCRRHYSDSDNPDNKPTGFAPFVDPEKSTSSRKVIVGRTPRSKVSKKRDVKDSDRFINHIIRGGTPCDPAPQPFQLANFGEESLYTLVLLRHGESEWNKLNQYTGWCDVNLTKKGEQEARDAGRLLYENGIEIDHAFTSVLKRASFSCNMALNTAKQHWVPATKTWRLNERHYGALQGYNKDTAFKELGLDQELVMQMRRSYDVRPPVMQNDHPYWHGNMRRCDKKIAGKRCSLFCN